MQNLAISFNAVAPVALLILVGMALGRAGKVDDHFIKAANLLVFQVALPVKMFLDVYRADIGSILRPMFMAVVAVSICASALVLWAVVPRLIRDSARAGAFIQAAFRGNYVVLGIALAGSLFGSEGEALASAVMPVLVVCMNVCVTLELTALAPGNSKKVDVKGMLVSLLRNPMILSMIVGLAFNWLALPVPAFAASALKSLGGLTTPLALVTLGAQLRLDALRRASGQLVWCCAIKLVFYPMIAMALASLLPLTGMEYGVLLFVTGSPTAVASFSMALAMGSDSEFTGQMVAVSTLLCVLTLFLWIFGLRQVGLIA